MKNKTVTVPLEWLEGLLDTVKRWIQENPEYYKDCTGLPFIIGYIQSAEHIIKQNEDETNKI